LGSAQSLRALQFQIDSSRVQAVVQGASTAANASGTDVGYGNDEVAADKTLLGAWIKGCITARHAEE
jgi:hypothetical protein